MKKIIFFFTAVFFAHFLSAQPAAPDKMWKQEQGILTRELRSMTLDSSVTYPLARHVEAETNTIYSKAIAGSSLPVLEKEKATRSLIYLLRELTKNVKQNRTGIYDIPASLQSYKNVLAAVLSKKGFTQFLLPVEARPAQVVSAAFTQYKEYPLMDDIAVYKRVAAQPQFILKFLETKPGFRFADSLILELAANEPEKLLMALQKDQPGLKERTSHIQNKYLQQVASLANDKNATELLPFTIALTNNRITAEEVLQKRTDVVKYYQLLVDAAQQAARSADAGSPFVNLLRKGLKEKSNAFFVNQVNDLHNSPDAVRFASVKTLRPEDMYYVITSGAEDLYTSSYLGLYKRLMSFYKNKSADSLFHHVGYDHFRTFMRLAANYNVLSDFLNNMPGSSAASILNRFIAGIESDAATGVEKAMDIADAFTGLAASPELSGMIEKELQANLERCKRNRQFAGIRLYSILTEVFSLVKQNDGMNKLWTKLGNYEVLKRSSLVNAKGEINQMVLFYGDDDGVSSFQSFSKLFADSSKWKTSRNQNWIHIRSRTDSSFSIYANQPLDAKGELDIKAQDALVGYLDQQSIEPVVLIHRGHSYHLDKTLQRIRPSVKLAILGSCGGYNHAISIATVNPDVQVIGSKKTGAMSINDPLIESINTTLLGQQDLQWPVIWDGLENKFSKDEARLSLFSEYIPPNKNLGLFVLKLFYINSSVV